MTFISRLVKALLVYWLWFGAVYIGASIGEQHMDVTHWTAASRLYLYLFGAGVGSVIAIMIFCITKKL